MNYLYYINIAQIVVAVLLVVVVLLQQKGTGLGGIFGGGGEVFRTKRGFEKKLHIFTIILAILFLGLALATVIL